jgi:hypothetical protein
MSLVDEFLNGAHSEVDSTMGTKSMVCGSQTFDVVWDDYRMEKEGVQGGLEPQLQAQATAQPGAVTNPRSLVHKRCTVGGDPFRILAVYVGTVAIRFDLGDPSESR